MVFCWISLHDNQAKPDTSTRSVAPFMATLTKYFTVYSTSEANVWKEQFYKIIFILIVYCNSRGRSLWVLKRNKDQTQESGGNRVYNKWNHCQMRIILNHEMYTTLTGIHWKNNSKPWVTINNIATCTVEPRLLEPSISQKPRFL